MLPRQVLPFPQCYKDVALLPRQYFLSPLSHRTPLIVLSPTYEGCHNSLGDAPFTTHNFQLSCLFKSRPAITTGAFRFSQQLHEVWAAFFYGNTGIVLPTGGGGQTDLIPSPWARSATTDAPAPCSLFVCLPVSSYLSSTHSMLMVGTSTVFRHFLVQTFNFAQWHLNYMCHAAVTS